MNSIAQVDGNAQGVKMSIGKFGLRASFKGLKSGKFHGGKRGKIEGFSKSSLRRLRELLWGKTIFGCHQHGVTLTVPWTDSDFDSAAEFRESLNRFAQMFKREFPHSAFIYRVELQQRKMPHLHAVAYIADDDFRNTCNFLEWYSISWFRSFKGNVHGGSLTGYFKHGVDYKPLEDNPTRLMRYLCDHASKRKQAQCGWKGRQWGVIGSSRLQDMPTYDLPPFPSERAEACFWRYISRVASYWAKADCPFGLKRIPCRRKWGVTFLPGGSETARKCFEAALQH